MPGLEAADLLSFNASMQQYNIYHVTNVYKTVSDGDLGCCLHSRLLTAMQSIANEKYKLI